MTVEEREEVRQHLGHLLFRLPIAALAARHEAPEGTLSGNYVRSRPTDSRAKRAAILFLKDVFSLSTQELVERWYPGLDLAAEIEEATEKWGKL